MGILLADIHHPRAGAVLVPRTGTGESHARGEVRSDEKIARNDQRVRRKTANEVCSVPFSNPRRIHSILSFGMRFCRTRRDEPDGPPNKSTRRSRSRIR